MISIDAKWCTQSIPSGQPQGTSIAPPQGHRKKSFKGGGGGGRFKC